MPVDQLIMVFAVYTGQLSHSQFSSSFQRKLQEGLQDSQRGVRGLILLLSMPLSDISF